MKLQINSTDLHHCMLDFKPHQNSYTALRAGSGLYREGYGEAARGLASAGRMQNRDMFYNHLRLHAARGVVPDRKPR